MRDGGCLVPRSCGFYEFCIGLLRILHRRVRHISKNVSGTGTELSTAVHVTLRPPNSGRPHFGARISGRCTCNFCDQCQEHVQITATHPSLPALRATALHHCHYRRSARCQKRIRSRGHRAASPVVTRHRQVFVFRDLRNVSMEAVTLPTSGKDQRVTRTEVPIRWYVWPPKVVISVGFDTQLE